MMHQVCINVNLARGDSTLSSNGNANIINVAGDTIGAENKDFTAPILSLRVFKYSEIRTATRNFRPDLCSDIFGGLFLCWVDNDTFTPSTKGVGISIAVKIYGEVHPNWQEEVTILGGLAHPNVTSLLGYCEDEKNCTLVYKWMKNPDFGHFLFKDVVEPLSWETRLMIIIGVARGIAYIHSSEDQVVHGDVRTSNIFLDQDFNAKLGAFGFKTFGPEAGITVSTCITCTAPYLDPEYPATCDWNVKCDIYSFGVVLLETLTGEQATKHGGESRMVKWASQFLANRSELKKIMDPRLEKIYPLNDAFKCAELALECVAIDRKCRPSSEEVLQRLEKIYVVNK